ncbi:MAG: ATP-dependent 6-phosphofructokinase, partial [Desulfobacterales bacterium]
MMNTEAIITDIPTLGEAKIPSPVLRRADGAEDISCVSDDDRVIINVDDTQILQMLSNGESLPCFELAGPRSKIFFDSSKLKCALVT